MDAEPRTGRPRPRRRRRGRVVVAATAVAVLLGIGSQWIGHGGGTPESGDGEAGLPDSKREPAPAQPPATPARLPAPAPGSKTGTDAGSRRAPEDTTASPGAATPVDPAPQVADDEPQPPPPSAPAVPVAEPSAADEAMDDDRFASLVSLVESRARAGRFAEAGGVLARLRDLAVGPAQRARIAALAGELEQITAATCREILALAGAGQVLAARATAAAALRDGDAGFRRALGQAFTAAGIGAEPEALPAAERARWPLPVPMPREREVRAELSDGPVRGTVVDSRSDRVTLRVEGPRGLTFPTLRATALEPVDAASAEAAELGFAALHGGDPLLARLWLGCALGRLPAGGCERTARLAELLR